MTRQAIDAHTHPSATLILRAAAEWAEAEVDVALVPLRAPAALGSLNFRGWRENLTVMMWTMMSRGTSSEATQMPPPPATTAPSSRRALDCLSAGCRLPFQRPRVSNHDRRSNGVPEPEAGAQTTSSYDGCRLPGFGGSRTWRPWDGDTLRWWTLSDEVQELVETAFLEGRETVDVELGGEAIRLLLRLETPSQRSTPREAAIDEVPLPVPHTGSAS